MQKNESTPVSECCAPSLVLIALEPARAVLDFARTLLAPTRRPTSRPSPA